MSGILKKIGQAIWNFFFRKTSLDKEWMRKLIIKACQDMYQIGYQNAKAGKREDWEADAKKSSLDDCLVEFLRESYQEGWQDFVEGRPDRVDEVRKEEIRLIEEQIRILSEMKTLLEDFQKELPSIMEKAVEAARFVANK